MSSDSPASILFDELGNPVGVIQDGVIYRLQVEAKLVDGGQVKITDGTSTVGITDVLGNKALKVDVIKTVASGGAGSGGTSSNFGDPFPIAGTAAGFTDGYFMQNATVFDLDTSAGVQYILGTNLRTFANGGSIEIGTSTHPLRIDPVGTTTQPISGTITANAGTGNFTVVQSTAANLNATVVGTITANIGTTGGLALDSSLTTIDTDIKATQPRDITDRAGRLLGIIYGSQDQQIKQTATNFNTQVEVAVGSTLIDPRQIRALTSADVVTANAGSGTFTIAGTVTSNQGTPNSIGNSWPVEITDGTNILGTNTHPIRIDPTGTTTQPVSGTVTSNIGTTGGLLLDSTFTGRINTQGQKTMSASTPVVIASDQSAIPVSQNGTWTVQQGTTGSGSASPWSVELSDGASFYTAAKTGQFPASLVGGRLDTNLGSWLGSTAPTVGSKTSANSVPVVIASDQGAIPVTVSSGIDRTSTGTITSTQNVSINTQASGSCGVQITGTWTGTLVFEATVDAGTTWNSVNAEVPTTGVAVTSTSTNGVWIIACAGYQQVRVRGNTVVTGTATIFLDSSTATQVVVLGDPLPTGSNTIGAVTQGTSPWVDNVSQFGGNNVVTGIGASGLGIPRVTVSNDSNILATQSGTWTVQPGNTPNTTPWLTTINQGGNSATVTVSNALKVDGSAVTQPVSGTVTANIGTTGGLALDTSVNGILVAQGSTTSGEKGPLIQGAVTTASPTYTTAQTSPLSLTTAGALRIDGSGITQPVSGTVTANQGTNPWVTNITQFGGNNVVTGIGASGVGIPRVTVSNDSNILATQSGSWTVTANIGTTNGLALDTSINGILVSQGSTTSGEKGPLIQGAVTTSAPLYTTAQTSPLSLTTSGLLRVDGSGVTQPVSGTVTANQGTSPWVSNITQFGSNNVVTGTGASGVGIPRVTVANDSNVLATQSGTWTVQQGTPPWSVVGPAASGAAVSGDPVRIGGSDGSNTRDILTDTSGRQIVAGAAANGAVVAGNPVLAAGYDGTNTRTLLTDSSGKLEVVVNSTSSGASTGLVFGQANTGATAGTLTSLRATTYTEQAANAQRSLKSTSANDTNTAGTGARTVQITYYDQTMAGPFTETVNLNGTTSVTTTNSNICFIEKMVVLTVGSTGSNQGTISLFANNAGTGTVIGSIAVGTIVTAGTIGDNRTLWAHHYVATGKTASIATISSGTTGNQIGISFLRTATPTVANSAELQITESLVTVSAAGSGSIFRIANTPLTISGPARITQYAVSNGTNTSFFGGFEFSEQ